jgi:hypothetical protein
MKIDSARNVDIFAGLSLEDSVMDEDKPSTGKEKRPSKWAVRQFNILSNYLII